MLRTGCIILSVWGGLHFIVSALSLLVSLQGKFAPMMKIVFTDAEIAMFDNRVLSVTKSLAIMHNTGATVFGALALVITWFGMNKSHTWAFWTLLLAGAAVHAMWFLSDAYIGNKTTAVNAVFSVLFLAGMAVSGYALIKGSGNA